MSSSLFLTAIIAGTLLLPPVATVWYYNRKNRTKASPLSQKQLRLPGHSLREKIDELTGDLMANLVTIPFLPVILYSLLLVIFQTSSFPPFILSLFILAVIISVGFFTIKNYKILQQRNRLRLAYECEVAVGQELHNKLIHGFRIFHDFPAEKFNIDHVVIGPSGVFAVETKGRAKFAKKENRNWDVHFDGTVLQFPGWEEREPVLQAERQAVWLHRWLGNATGENIPVTPVLALAGWYVVREKSSNILIYNGKNPDFLAKRSQILSEQQIHNVAFQVENRCRDIGEKSYKELTFEEQKQET